VWELVSLLLSFYVRVTVVVHQSSRVLLTVVRFHFVSLTFFCSCMFGHRMLGFLAAHDAAVVKECEGCTRVSVAGGTRCGARAPTATDDAVRE